MVLVAGPSFQSLCRHEALIFVSWRILNKAQMLNVKNF